MDEIAVDEVEKDEVVAVDDDVVDNKVDEEDFSNLSIVIKQKHNSTKLYKREELNTFKKDDLYKICRDEFFISKINERYIKVCTNKNLVEAILIVQKQ